MRRLKLLLGAMALLLILGSISGCASMGTNVWDRDILAKPTMQFDHQATDRAIDDHIYFSDEAASGGRGFGGGGCGCN
jgi:hypothetical protein